MDPGTSASRTLALLDLGYPYLEALLKPNSEVKEKRMGFSHSYLFFKLAIKSSTSTAAMVSV